MASPRAEIEHTLLAAFTHEAGERLEIGALRMNAALEIFGGSVPELPADQGFLGFRL
jgi:hypothetical protein